MSIGLKAQRQPHAFQQQDHQGGQGSLAGRRALVAQPEPSRARAHAAARAADPGAGARPAPANRLVSRFQDGRERCSELTHELLRALSVADGAAVNDDLVLATSRSMLRILSSHVDAHMHQSVLRDAIKQQVMQLNQEQLLSVRNGLAQTSGDDDPLLLQIGETVTRRLEEIQVSPDMQAAARAACFAAEHRPDELPFTYRRLLLKAPLVGENGDMATRRVYVVRVLNRLLHAGDMTVAQLKGVITRLPRDEQQAILQVDPRADKLGGLAQEIAGICLLAQRDGPSQQPLRFARALIATDQNFRSSGSARRMPGFLAQARDELLRSELESVLQAGSFAVETLGDAELRDVSSILERLHVNGGRGKLASEMRRRGGATPQEPTSRTRELSAKARRFADRFLNAVALPAGVRADSKIRVARIDADRQVDKLLALVSKETPDVASDRAAAQQILTGLRHSTRPMTRRGLSFDLEFSDSLRRKVEKLTRDQLCALRRALVSDAVLDPCSPEGVAIQVAVSTELERRLAKSADSALASMLVGALTAADTADELARAQYERMMTTAGQLLAAHGSEPPAGKTAAREARRAVVLDALACGLERRDFDELDVQAFMAKLGEGEQRLIGARGPTGVRGGLAAHEVQLLVASNLLRSSADDGVHAAFDPAGLAADMSEPVQKKVFSRIASHDLSLGIQSALLTTASPLRVDGQPARLLGESRSSLQTEQLPDGRLLARYTYEIDPATLVVKNAGPDRGRALQLPREAHARFTYAFTVWADGHVAMAEPVRVRYDVQTSLSVLTAPPPTSFAGYLAPEARAALDLLIAFAEREQGAENLQFLLALKRFESDTTGSTALNRAQEIEQIFLQPSSASVFDARNNAEVNVSADLKREIREALSRNEPMSHEQLRALFAPAGAEVTRLVQTNALPRFRQALRAGRVQGSLSSSMGHALLQLSMAGAPVAQAQPGQREAEPLKEPVEAAASLRSRAQDARTEFMNAFDVLNKDDILFKKEETRLEKPVDFAKTLIAAAEHWDRYEAVRLSPGSPLAGEDDHELSRTVELLNTRVEEFLAPGKFPYHELDDADLGRMKSAFGKLGVQADALAAAVEAQELSRVRSVLRGPGSAADFVAAVSKLASALPADRYPAEKDAHQKLLLARTRQDLPMGGFTLSQLNELRGAFKALGLAALLAQAEAQMHSRANGAALLKQEMDAFRNKGKGAVPPSVPDQARYAGAERSRRAFKASVQQVRSAIKSLELNGRAVEMAVIRASKLYKDYLENGDPSTDIPETFKEQARELRTMIEELNESNAAWIRLVQMNRFLERAVESLGFRKEESTTPGVRVRSSIDARTIADGLDPYSTSPQSPLQLAREAQSDLRSTIARQLKF